MNATPPATGGRAVASSAQIWSALGAVYVIWGTTYFAIRVTNETLPPLIAAGIRFVVAGVVLYAWAVRRGDVRGDRPTRANWIAAALVGTGLVAGGNGLVVLAELTVPTGIVALIIALVPLWMALIDRVLLGHEVRWATMLGLLLGFGGIVLLIGGATIDAGVPMSGIAVAVTASLCWTSASLYSRTAPLPHRPLVGAGMEMLIGGSVLLVAGTLRGELARVDPSAFSVQSILALLYLIAIGSWVGFTSYVWLLRNARTSLVSTYAYVNPIVAVTLGWLVLDESITARILLAAAVIIAGVAIIISSGDPARERPTPVLEGEVA